MRIHELAKKYNVTSDELIVLLKNAGYDVANHMSAVDYDMLSALDRHFAWANTPGKKPAKKSTATSKAAKAAAADTGTKAKVKLRKAKVAEPEPAPAPVASDKPKVKLAKAVKPAPVAEAPPGPLPAVLEPAVELKLIKAAEKAPEAKVEKKPEARKDSPRAKAEADAARRAEDAARAKAAKPPKPPKPKAVNPLDELSVGPITEPLIAVEPDTGDEVEEWTAADEARRHAAMHPKTSDAEQVRESVRRTLAKLETTRKTKRRKTRPEAPTALPPVRVQEGATPSVLSAALGVSIDDVISRAASFDVKADANTPLEKDTIELVAEEFGRRVDVEASYGETQLKIDAQIDVSKLAPRAPVVTIMGHVDHGKTSILDYIRKANVAAGEAGGITQAVGAYEATIPGGGKITFIDTPGHEAFTAMRSRGARITDIVVIVVAADDGVMPQTIEAINHTLAAKVPMIIAINKSDLPSANPGAVKQQLANQNVLVEEYGGQVVSVEVSARTGKGIDKLLEMILLQAELAELKADPTARAQGVVVEVKKEEGRGILVTALVQQGTLNIGDVFVVGNEYGKVRSLFDYNGKALRQAGPSTPVVVLGLDGLPEPGDTLIAVKNEREAREVALKRQEATRAKELQPTKALTLEQLYEQIQGGAVKELNLILKCDTNGSVEALRDSLAPMVVEAVKVNVIHAGVGNVSESDVLLAMNTGAVIIAFSTKVTPKAKDIAKLKGIDIRSYKIIYEVIEDVDKAMKGMLEPVFVERVLGRAEVRKLFRVTKLGTIAGSMVVDGQIVRNASARVLRNEQVIYTGKVTSLKRFQDDVREVNTNFECGIGVGYDDLVEHDIIEAYVVEEKVRVF